MMILEKIRQVYPTLTKSQKQLADYIATSYREVAFMTASRLARVLSLNEATVIRFAQRLGYAGYPQMAEEIQAVVQAELVSTSHEPESPESAIAHVVAAEIDSVQRAMSHIPEKVLLDAVALFRAAERTFVLGQGAGAPLARLLSLGLRIIGQWSESPSADPLNLAMALRDLSAGDVVVTVSLALETQELANALTFSRERGAHAVAITWSHVSRCAQVAELVIVHLPDEHQALRPFAPLAMLIDCLLQAMVHSDEETGRHVAEFAEIRDRLVEGY